MNKESNMTEQEFLDQYDANRYEKPSVTADILIFAMNEEHHLELLLIKRAGHPFQGKWAVPGGFVGITESVDEAARRELLEETGLNDIYLEQLYTFGAVDRDPRMRVISVAYMALISRKRLAPRAGDDAAEAKFFRVYMDNWMLKFKADDGTELLVEDLAFDHKDVIQMGLTRLAGKVDYTGIAFELLEDKNCFTIYELQRVYECIKGVSLDAGNFRKFFKARFLDEGLVRELESVSKKYSKKPSKCFAYKR